MNGLDVGQTASRLRRYTFIEQGLMRQLARLLDHADHVGWLRTRLTEMRGGQIAASVAPALALCVAETVHAGSVEGFVAGAYGVLQTALRDAYRNHLAAADLVANAADVRLLKRMLPNIEAHLAWAAESVADAGAEGRRHAARVAGLLDAARGVSGEADAAAADATTIPPPGVRFERPRTILFDARIARGELTGYEERKQADAHTAAIEDFKVFFNEMYAAALLASILYDAPPSEYPWEFLADVARHFWDEARHSQFGATRLAELGVAPSVCNPVLFEQSQGLPVLHRFCYLTMGLETYFMPRKRPRVTKYTQAGDTRSQRFADQDWSDETLHVRFGKRWMNHLLQDDFRAPDDILAEVRAHLEAAGVRDAPF